jgi:hypothetical protein
MTTKANSNLIDGYETSGTSPTEPACELNGQPSNDSKTNTCPHPTISSKTSSLENEVQSESADETDIACSIDKADLALGPIKAFTAAEVLELESAAKEKLMNGAEAEPAVGTPQDGTKDTKNDKEKLSVWRADMARKIVDHLQSCNGRFLFMSRRSGVVVIAQYAGDSRLHFDP